MAIKIPSKNIYEMNNPKIRDNVIDNVSVEQTVVTPNNEYETPVFNGKYIPNSFVLRNTENRKTVGEIITLGADVGLNGVWIANAEILNQEVSNFIITIPKLKENKVIQNIFYKKNDDEENQIKYTVYGKIQKGSCSRTIGWAMPSGILTNPITANITSVGKITFEEYTEESEETSFDYNSNIVASISGTPNANALFEREVIASLKPIDISSVISYNDIENEFIVSFDVMSKITVVKLGGMDFVPTTKGNLALSGQFEKYIPTQIEITIYGNTIGIDLTDGSVTYGSGNKPHSLNRNELLQDSATSIVKQPVEILLGGIQSDVTYGTVIKATTFVTRFRVGEKIEYNNEISTITATGISLGNNFCYIQIEENGEFYKNANKLILVERHLSSNLSKHIAENILSQYAKGKETATLLCDIADYYDESGEKVIDIKTNEMSFRLHDKVIPYVFGANGEDFPMSKYQDGSPKVFEVVGSNIIYDGAVWQELNLQEISQNT